MGGRGAKSSAGQYQILGANGPNIVPTQQQAQAANASVFSATDNRPYHDFFGGKQYFQNQNLTIDQQLATINYLSDNPEPGTLYSMSQNMNNALATGQKLTANQKYVYDQMMSAMHNLGENMNLTRYDHSAMIDNLLASKGLSGGYENYSVAQLKKALVGTKYGENKMVSTSYNDFKNAPLSSASVFKSRAVKISYQASAGTQAMMPGKGPGGDLGEIVISSSGRRKNYTIKDVRFTGQMSRRKGTQSYSLPQVEIIVEVK